MPIELLVAVTVIIGFPASVFFYALFVGYEEKQPFESEDDWGSQDYHGRK